jgi:hypothetical protein
MVYTKTVTGKTWHSWRETKLQALCSIDNIGVEDIKMIILHSDDGAL